MQKNGISKLVIGLALLFIGGGLLIWALSGRSTEAPVNETPASETTGAEVPAAKAEAEDSAVIAFARAGFTPDKLTVRKGAAITIRNESDVNVQLSSNDHPLHRDNEELNIEVLEPGESASFTVSKVGTWGFHNHINESNTGTLAVTE